MTIEHAVAIYAVIFLIILAPMIWLFMRRRAAKRAAKIGTADKNQSPSITPARQPINWAAWFELRPQAWLTGEMWLKCFIFCLLASAIAIVVVIYAFPLGALWAASAAFVGVLVIVVLGFNLLE